jgi:hypothetical protein
MSSVSSVSSVSSSTNSTNSVRGMKGVMGALWLIWRQQRGLVISAAAAVVVSFLAVTVWRSGTVAALGDDAVRSCVTLKPGCHWEAADGFSYYYVNGLYAAGLVNLAVPLLIGVFWGAPLLAREIELGTSSLLFTQGVSRARWFTQRFAAATACAVVLCAVLALLIDWWRTALVSTASSPVVGLHWYDAIILNGTGPRAVAAGVFALAVGTAAGLVLRRVLPAMALTLVTVAGVEALLALCRRAWVPPRMFSSPGIGPGGMHTGDAWLAGTGYLTASGKRGSSGACPIASDLRQCLGQHGYVSRFYMANRRGDFWTFQWIDTGVLVTLTVALLALTAWLLHKRRI